MGILDKLFLSFMASRSEKKGDESTGTYQARCYYEEAIGYKRDLGGSYYDLLSLKEKIGKTYLEEARKKNEADYIRIKNYKEAYSILKEAESYLSQKAALEHCALDCNPETLNEYKNNFQSRLSSYHWISFLYDLVKIVKKQDKIELFGNILLLEFAKAETYCSNSSIRNFIKKFELSEKANADMYYYAAENIKMYSLDKSNMYNTAAFCFKNIGNNKKWLECLKKKYKYFLEEWDWNYLVDDNDITEITRLLGNDYLLEFFYDIIPYFFSDSDRITIQRSLNKQEYWVIFCEALLKRIDQYGINSFGDKNTIFNIEEALRKRINLDKELGLKLGKTINLSEYGLNELKNSKDNLYD